MVQILEDANVSCAACPSNALCSAQYLRAFPGAKQQQQQHHHQQQEQQQMMMGWGMPICLCVVLVWEKTRAWREVGMFIYPKRYLDQLGEESPATTVDGSEIPRPTTVWMYRIL